jgi:hypothetical protein
VEIIFLTKGGNGGVFPTGTYLKPVVGYGKNWKKNHRVLKLSLGDFTPEKSKRD